MDPGFIALAERLAYFSRQIYEYGFTAAHAADRRYAQFRTYVRNVESALVQLQDLADQLHTDDFTAVIAALQEAFEECERLILDNEALGHRVPTAGQNLRWNYVAERRITALQDRVNANLDMAGHLIRPLLLQAQIVRPANRLHTRQVPEVLASRFEEAVTWSPPPTFIDLGNFPLTEGFEALHRHFGSIGPRSVRGPTGQQCINLVKSHWILQTIVQSDQYPPLMQNDLQVCHARVERYEQQIEDAYQRFERRSNLQNVINEMVLTPAVVAIWNSQPPTPEEDAKVEILALQLRPPTGHVMDDLHVYRVTPTTLKLITRRARPLDGIRTTEQTFETLQDRLVPLYAIPRENSPCSLRIHSPADATSGRTLTFSNPSQMFDFQRAITSYRVAASHHGVLWTYPRSSFRRGGGDKIVAIQLWTYDPLIETVNTSPTTPDNGSIGNSTMSRGTQVIALQPITTTALRSLPTSLGEGMRTAFLPLIVLYFIDERGKVELVSLELKIGLCIDPQGCSCSRGHECCHLSIIDATGHSLVTRKNPSESQKKGIQGNIALLGRPAEIRLSNISHRLSKDETIETINYKYWRFEFRTAVERKMFGEILQEALTAREVRVIEFRRDQVENTIRSEQPVEESQASHAHRQMGRRMSSRETVVLSPVNGDLPGSFARSPTLQAQSPSHSHRSSNGSIVTAQYDNSPQSQSSVTVPRSSVAPLGLPLPSSSRAPASPSPDRRGTAPPTLDTSRRSSNSPTIPPRASSNRHNGESIVTAERQNSFQHQSPRTVPILSPAPFDLRTLSSSQSRAGPSSERRATAPAPLYTSPRDSDAPDIPPRAANRRTSDHQNRPLVSRSRHPEEA